MPQTFFDVRVTEGRCKGLYSNMLPLRRPEAEKLAVSERANGHKVEIVPTHYTLWEETYGDKNDKD